MTAQGAVLVTGGAGYIGSQTAWALVDAGREVVILDDLSTGVIGLAPPAARLIQGSVGDAELVGQILREHDVRSIFHFAGSVVVPDSIANPRGYYRNNTANSLSLIEAAVAHGVSHFIFSSTAAVYEPVGTSLLTEIAATGPQSPYGWSKLMTERMLADIGQADGLKWLILRYFNVAGADPIGRTGQSTARATHLIKVACEVAVGRRPLLEVFGDDYETPDGTCVRDYIHVADLADAHVQGLRYLEKGGPSQIFNCGYGQATSVKDVIAMVEHLTGGPLPFAILPRRPGDAPYVVADSSALRQAMNWTPRYGELEAIIASALAWEQRIG